MINADTLFGEVSTEIPTLDDALKGGIPVPSDVLLLGDAGTGKSVFCQQFLHRQSEKGFKTVYFCIDHPEDDIKENMLSLGWNTNRNIEFYDVFLGEREFDFRELVEIIKEGL